MSSKGNIYFSKVDIFRFLAAFYVVFVHTFERWKHSVALPGIFNSDNKYYMFISERLQRFILNGSFGVDMFFLISGFLITFLLLNEKESNGTISLKNFYARRALRIWPLYYFIILIAPLMVSWLSLPSPHYFSTALFYNNFHTISEKYWLFPFAHFWSLSIEEHFYLFWTLLIKLIPKEKLRSTLFVLLFSSIIFRFYLYYIGNGDWFDYYLNTFSRMDVLMIGSIAAIEYFENKLVSNSSTTIRFLLFVILIIALSIDDVLLFDSAFAVLFKKYFYVLICGYLMVGFMLNKNPVFKWMDNSLFRYLGKISYGVYIFHLIII
jgi:peptidoglycan/LPS O-acetylase OafA/YrhL